MHLSMAQEIGGILEDATLKCRPIEQSDFTP